MSDSLRPGLVLTLPPQLLSRAPQLLRPSESRRTPGVDNAGLMPPWAERPPLLSVSSLLLPPLRPIRTVTNTHRELPSVHMGHSDKFLDYLMESSQGGKVLPTWKGEQYLHLESVGMVYDDAEKLYVEVREVFMSVYTNGADHFVLRNASMHLTISHKRITSPFDVQLDCKLIQEGATGGLVVFEDRPNHWDACNVKIHNLEKATHQSAKILVVTQDPLRVSVRVWVVYEQSRFSITVHIALTLFQPRQHLTLASPTLDSRSMLGFNAWVDWH
ncbi:hypothetical protein K438DRAFT_1980800 [Mycena galopus ATCC 62051]|nr:hypothetical protein K438DRAFT_1980800 [Mycena galopus ATCC 62051]